jgi:P2-related tail formation protein
MNRKIDEMFQNALAYLESLSPDEFEQELRAVGVNPVRLETHKYKTILFETYTTGNYMKRQNAKTNLNTSFSGSHDNFFYKAA